MSASDHKSISADNEVVLRGLNGSNPVCFLAALGAMQSLQSSGKAERVRMKWKEIAGDWRPVVISSLCSVSELAQEIAVQLKCPFTPDATSESLREERQKAFDAKKTELKRAREALKKKKLRGKERDAEYTASVAPVEKELADSRDQWLEALRQCVPSMELSLGKHLNAEQDELRDTLIAAIKEASIENRTVVDMLASFGSDACLMNKSVRMDASPFCFVTGSGHQYFLDTARQLTEKVTAERIESALSTELPPSDEKLSMRWDPNEDRRYALMWDDPTSSSNKTLTNWAINLLAYHGLQLWASVPTNRYLRTVGWSGGRIKTWTWPVWNVPLTSDVVRTTLALDFKKTILAQRGVAAVYRTCRLQVGNPPLHKINFSPPERIA